MTHLHDYLSAYIGDLAQIIDMDMIRSARLNLGIDPLGGSGVAYWQPLADRYGLNIDIGIVTRSTGLMNPNHDLAVSISYLFANRPRWKPHAGIGKTLVSYSLIDHVARKLGRKLVEVPVDFKWFVNGLFDGSLGFGGEESAGASFLRRVGSVWTTDKDGIIMNLLAAEMMARTGRDPGELYRDLTIELGEPVYERGSMRQPGPSIKPFSRNSLLIK